MLVAVDGVCGELPPERSVISVNTLLRWAEAKLLTSDGWHRVVRFQPLPGQTLGRVDQTRITQTLVYLLMCAAGSTSPESELQASVLIRGDRIEVTIGVRGNNVSGSGGDGRVPLEPPLDSQTDPIDDALRLSACRKALEAHGVELEVGKADEPNRMFSFKLPVLAAGR